MLAPYELNTDCLAMLKLSTDWFWALFKVSFDDEFLIEAEGSLKNKQHRCVIKLTGDILIEE